MRNAEAPRSWRLTILTWRRRPGLSVLFGPYLWRNETWSWLNAKSSVAAAIKKRLLSIGYRPTVPIHVTQAESIGVAALNAGLLMPNSRVLTVRQEGNGKGARRRSEPELITPTVQGSVAALEYAFPTREQIVGFEPTSSAISARWSPCADLNRTPRVTTPVLGQLSFRGNTGRPIQALVLSLSGYLHLSTLALVSTRSSAFSGDECKDDEVAPRWRF